MKKKLLCITAILLVLVLLATYLIQYGVGAIRSRVSELIQEGHPIKKGWRKNQINGLKNIRTYYIERN